MMTPPPTHTRPFPRLAGFLYLAALATSTLACASTPADTATAADTKATPIQLAQARTATRTSSSSKSFEFESTKNSVALLTRDLSAKSGRNIVLMNGVEMSQAGPYEKKKRSAAEWVDQIAADAGLRVQHHASYDFIFAPGYEVVNATTVDSRLDPALAARRTTLHIEFGTPLFAALALLGHSLQSAIVADNVVADARCGETRLHDVTVAEALGALLQSARIPNESFLLRNNDGSTFLYSAGRPLRAQVRVEAPGEARPEWLDRRVTLYLPAAPAEAGHLPDYGSAVPLGECLKELERQTGLHVEADARVLSLPINPSVMPNLRIETALDLIVNQWPLPHFGYRANGNTLRFVYLGPPVE